MAKQFDKPKMKPCKACGELTERKLGKQFCKPCVTRRNWECARRWRLLRGAKIVGTTAECRRCGKTFTFKGGKRFYCEDCPLESVNERQQRYAVRHHERRLETYRKHNEKRKTDEKYQLSMQRYRREIATPSLTRKRRNDPRTNLDHRMGQLIRVGLIAGKSGRTWRSLVDYSVDELMRHLERQFVKGMSWQNMGEWHVDHIVPRSHFIFTTAEDEEFRACWALTNLRPLWSMVNYSKGSKRLFLL